MILHFFIYAFLYFLKFSLMNISNFIIEGKHYLESFFLFLFFKKLGDTLLLTRHNKLQLGVFVLFCSSSRIETEIQAIEKD